MTKKKIRYSEFPAAGGEAPEAPKAPPKAPAKRARAAAAPVAEPDAAPTKLAQPEVVQPEPVQPEPVQPEPVATTPKERTPLELARALAAARAAEQSSEAWAKTPAAPLPAVPAAPLPRATVTMSLSRLTPVHGTPAIAAPGIRLTPTRGSLVIPAAASLPLTEASASLRDRVRTRSGLLELLVFRVAEELFGVELAAVEEAIDLPALRYVPEMPPSMLGVITVRGSLTSTYSPESALGLTLASRGSALIFKRGHGRVALVVDDVDDVFTLDLAQLRDPPGGDAGDGILLGVLRRTDALLGLVDAEALIAACQAVPVLESA